MAARVWSAQSPNVGLTGNKGLTMKSVLPVLLFVPAALLLLAIGVWFGWPGWVITIMVTVPLVFGVIAMLLGRRANRAKPGDKYDISSQGAHSVGRLEVAIPQTDVAPFFRAAVAETPRLKLRSVDEDGAELDAALNWKTWGLVLSAKFHPVEESRTRIVVNSSPRMKTTVIDYGQSRSDIRDLFEALERQVASRQEQP